MRHTAIGKRLLYKLATGKPLPPEMQTVMPVLRSVLLGRDGAVGLEQAGNQPGYAEGGVPKNRTRTF